jgi:hypothetical protein
MPHIRLFLIGLFIVTAFFVTGTILRFVITADHLQSSMSAPNLSSVKTSIGAIRQDVASVEYYYKILDVISAKQTEAEERQSAATAAAQGAMSEMTSLADDITSDIEQNYAAAIQPPLDPRPFLPGAAAAPAAPSSPGGTAQPAGAFAQNPILDFDTEVAGYFAEYYTKLGPPRPETSDARAALDRFRNEVFAKLRAFSAAHARYDANTSAAQSARAQLEALIKQKGELDKSVAPDGSALANSDYWNLCEDFYSFKELVGDLAYKVVLLPKMMLVLVLSIFMGILGSLIFLSQEFLRDPDGRSIWDILFRISLGAGVAFALFFFAAAGMLALSQNGGPQSEMSPYLISFLGITGGYLSDRVMQWMRQVGENTFKIEGAEPPRWALGLDAALKASGLNDLALASATGVTKDDAESWIALTKPVPPDKQPLVAAFLRIHPSKLFTDIAPG